MPRHDDDDDPRPRRRPVRRDEDDEEDDEEDRPRRRRSAVDRPAGRSGGVTTVGVLTMVVGGLEVLWSCGCAIGGVVFATGGVAAGQMIQDQNPQMENAKGMLAAIGAAGAVMLLLGAAVMFAVALVFLFSGYGVVRRRGWARITTLILAALVGLFGLLGVLMFIMNLVVQNRTPLPSLLGGRVMSVLLVAYAVLSYAFLIPAAAAEEFR